MHTWMGIALGDDFCDSVLGGAETGVEYIKTDYAVSSKPFLRDEGVGGNRREVDERILMLPVMVGQGSRWNWDIPLISLYLVVRYLRSCDGG